MPDGDFIPTNRKPRFVHDLTGQQHGDWFVVGFSHKTTTKTYWVCRCKAGHFQEISSTNLRYRNPPCRACVRAAKEQTNKQQRRDSARWRHIMRRARKCNTYVHPEWRDGCKKFTEDVGRPPTSDKTKYRLMMHDPLMGLVPGNVYWKEIAFQLERKGVRKSIAAWAKQRGITRQTLYNRIAQYGGEGAFVDHLLARRVAEAIAKVKTDYEASQEEMIEAQVEYFLGEAYRSPVLGQSVHFEEEDEPRTDTASSTAAPSADTSPQTTQSRDSDHTQTENGSVPDAES